MTQNQIAAQGNMIKKNEQLENARHNKAVEAETKRKNLETEKLEARGQNLSLISNLGGSAIKGLTSLTNLGSKKGKNHPSWTNRFPDLTKLVASLPLDVPYGDPTTLSQYLMNGSATSDVSEAVLPSVTCVRYAPLLGKSDQDAIRVVSAQMYTWLRSVNSGARNYERADLILYLLYGSSIVSLFAYVAKILACANTFSKTNKMVGKSIVRALTSNSETTWNRIMNDRANLVARFNVLTRRFNSFFLPATFPVIQRWMWLAGFISKMDSKDDLGPIMVTRPEIYYKFTTEDPTGGTDTSGKLKPFVIPENASVETLLGIISDCIDAFFNYEDMAIIAGDIHHAFGEDERNYVRLNPIDVSVDVEIYHSKEDLTEFINADVVGPLQTDSLYIYQNEVTHELEQKGKFNGLLTSPGVDVDGIISEVGIGADIQEGGALYIPEGVTPIILPYPEISTKPEDLLKYSSFKTLSQEQLVWSGGQSGKWYRIITEFRTDIITRIVTYGGINNIAENVWQDFGKYNSNVVLGSGSQDNSLALRSPLDYLKYNPYIPMMRFIIFDTTIGTPIKSSKIYPNYTTQAVTRAYQISRGIFDSMLDISLMSLYGMDVFGTSQRFQAKFDVR